MKINIMYFKECNLILPLWRFTLFHNLHNHPPWRYLDAHHPSCVNRIKMDWRNTQGPVLI